jgi:hypothetical protein
MIYGRFRAGETNATLTWIEGASGPRQRGPATATGPATDVAAGRSRPLAIGGHALAGQVIQGRSILGPAGVLRYLSTSLLRATPAPHLLYRRQLWQICQTGKVSAYRTLPPARLCVGKNGYYRTGEIRHPMP